MMQTTSFRAFVVLTALAVGCGDLVDEVVPPGGSCNVPAGGICVDFTGSAWRTPSAAQSFCTQLGQSAGATATYGSGRCATTSRVGLCVRGAGSVQEAYQAFYSSRFNTQAAQVACAMVGTWRGI
ncbi:MAG: hypothetical protein U0324_41900 [Polyangiales bacterium]